MKKYVRNLTPGSLDLRMISLRLSPAGRPGDTKPLRRAGHEKHANVLSALEKGWICLLSHEEFASRTSGVAVPVVKPAPAAKRKPVEEPKPAPLPRIDTRIIPEEEPAAKPLSKPALRVRNLTTFKAMSATEMAAVIDEIGLADEVDQRSKRKMTMAYRGWLKANS